MSPLSVEDAIKQADWLVRYAIDRLGLDGREYSAQVSGLLASSAAPLQRAVHWSQREHDRVVEGEQRVTTFVYRRSTPKRFT